MKKKIVLLVGIVIIIAGLAVGGVLFMRHQHRTGQDYATAPLSAMSSDEVKVALKDKTLTSYESWQSATITKDSFINSGEAAYVARALELLGSYDASLRAYQVLEQLLPAGEKNASFYVSYGGIAAVAQKPDVIEEAHRKADEYLATLTGDEKIRESLVVERGFAMMEGE